MVRVAGLHDGAPARLSARVWEGLESWPRPHPLDEQRWRRLNNHHLNCIRAVDRQILARVQELKDRNHSKRTIVNGTHTFTRQFSPLQHNTAQSPEARDPANAVELD